MSNTFIASLFLLLVSFNVPQYSLFKVIPLEADFFTVDNLGNVYIVKKDILEKYNAQGILQHNYSNKTYGEINFVDASNPLKLLVYYKNFSRVVFLDNMLSIQGKPVLLEQYNLFQTNLVYSSYNSGLWIYDQRNFELLRFDQNMQVTHRTGNLTQLLGTEIKPDYLTEYNKQVYLNNPQTGILVFDLYGTYYKTIPLLGLNNFQVSDEYITYFRQGNLISYHLKTFDQDTLSVPDTTAKSVKIAKKALYLLKENSLEFYKEN